jgi:hypothetical protein
MFSSVSSSQPTTDGTSSGALRQPIPVFTKDTVQGSPVDFASVALNTQTMCGTATDQPVRCYGSLDAVLGAGASAANFSADFLRVKQVAIGFADTLCVLLSGIDASKTPITTTLTEPSYDGMLLCRGTTPLGFEFSAGATDAMLSLAAFNANTSSRWRSVALGRDHACAVTAAAGVPVCVGSNLRGQTQAPSIGQLTQVRDRGFGCRSSH